MGEKKVKPPKLPKGAPAELRNFLACKIMEVDLDPTQAAWIPKPDLVPEELAPTVTVAPTGTNALSVSVGWGFVSITLPVALADGQLQIDSTNLPGQEAIDAWVKSFNDALKANDKELSGLELRDGKIHLTKRVIAAPEAQPTTPVAQPTEPVAQPTDPVAQPTEPVTTPANDEGLKPGCLIGIIAVFILFLGVGVAFVVNRGDDSKSSDTNQTTSSPAPTTTAEPVDEKLICANLAILEQVLADFGVDDPCEIAPDDFWDACEDYMPCFLGGTPLIALSPTVGITHNGSVPDVTTAQTGPSEAEHLVQVVGPVFDATASVDVTSQCGNDTINGSSLLTSTGVTSIKHPLFNYGQCRAEVFYRTAGARQLIGSYDYTVSDAAIATGQPDTTGVSVPSEASLNAAGTTLGLLGGKPLDLACTWYSTNSDALSLAQCLNDRWVFNAGQNDARVLSYGAGYVNPVGIAGPSSEQLAPFGVSRLFGPGTLFPCGSGHLGFTACAANEPPVATSGFIAGTVSFAQLLNEVPVDTYVEVGVEEYWVRLLRGTDSWTLTASEGDDSQSRAILRGNAITFMIPYDESVDADLRYTLSVGDATGAIDQAPQPVLGLVTSTQGPETPADFFRQLSNSIATGDLTYALGRLHPLVYEAFPGDQCATELALRVTPDYQITVDSVGATAPWTWQLPDGRSVEIPEAITVSIRLPNTADPVESHLVVSDRMHYWFTVCDQR